MPLFCSSANFLVILSCCVVSNALRSSPAFTTVSKFEFSQTVRQSRGTRLSRHNLSRNCPARIAFPLFTAEIDGSNVAEAPTLLTLRRFHVTCPEYLHPCTGGADGGGRRGWWRRDNLGHNEVPPILLNAAASQADATRPRSPNPICRQDDHPRGRGFVSRAGMLLAEVARSDRRSGDGPLGRHWLTALLIIANALLFAATLASGGALMEAGAKVLCCLSRDRCVNDAVAALPSALP